MLQLLLVYYDYQWKRQTQVYRKTGFKHRVLLVSFIIDTPVKPIKSYTFLKRKGFAYLDLYKAWFVCKRLLKPNKNNNNTSMCIEIV